MGVLARVFVSSVTARTRKNPRDDARRPTNLIPNIAEQIFYFSFELRR